MTSAALVPHTPVPPWSVARCPGGVLPPRPRVSALPEARARVRFALASFSSSFTALVAPAGLLGGVQALPLAVLLALHATMVLAFVADAREWLPSGVDPEFAARWDAVVQAAAAHGVAPRWLARAQAVAREAEELTEVQRLTGVPPEAALRALVRDSRAVYSALRREAGRGRPSPT